MNEQGHGGQAVTRTLKALGVDNLFTLTGGHIFPILDGCRQDGIRIIDVRHEQTAGYAAEGWSRLTRSLGVCAVTAGPGVTNVMSPLAQARFNSAPLLVLAGRAPSFRWGQGSLQEIDHVPFVDPLVPAATVPDSSQISAAIVAAAQRGLAPPQGPQFLDFPLDVLFNTTELPAEFDLQGAEVHPDFDGEATGPSVTELIATSERPILIAGSKVWLERADDSLRHIAEQAEIPVFMNGQGRGCLPADHRLAFSRSRSAAFKETDLVIVIGTPMDFRLGFGQGFAPTAKIVHLDSAPAASHVELEASRVGPLKTTLGAIADGLEGPLDTKAWIESLRTIEDDKRDKAQVLLSSDARPIHPMRIYGELVPLLERNAIVIGDGGDFVSYAGKEVPSHEPGRWLDPGPYGCLGCGSGYALAARVAHPDEQVVLLYGDGAIGFSLAELETMVRLKLPVVCVVGNNGIWALEKHPMAGLYGHDVAADLQPGLRYDQIMEAFGGRGELVADPDEISPALKRAFESGEPSLINVITDPDVAYPRSSNLA